MEPEGAPPVVELYGVTKVYGERIKTQVLHGIDLVVRRSEFAALIGPSGSGKSTLLNILGALDRPSGGRVRIDGRDIGTLPDDDLAALRNRTIGFVFQFHHLLPEFTALENVMLPLVVAAGRATERARGRAEELLRRVGLAERMHHRSTDLSGGQQQRVAIARALANRPLLVLADEPTGNLDSRAGDEVYTLLREINAETGTTFLIVTHDPRIAARADRVIEIADGRIRSDRAVATACG